MYKYEYYFHNDMMHITCKTSTWYIFIPGIVFVCHTGMYQVCMQLIKETRHRTAAAAEARDRWGAVPIVPLRPGRVIHVHAAFSASQAVLGEAYRDGLPAESL